jgi:hypothetical protein
MFLKPLAKPIFSMGPRWDSRVSGRQIAGVVAGFPDLMFLSDSGLIDYRPTRSP